MKRFRFRLESVRKLRKDHEQEKAGELAEAIAEAGDAEEKAARLAAMEAAGRSQMTKLDGDVGRQRSVAVMLEHLAEHHAAAARASAEANGRVEERQAEFREAVTQRQAIDRLKERKYEAWDTGARREDQKTTDEVNVNRHGAGSAQARRGGE